MLGEQLTTPILLGAVGAVAGVMIISWQGKARRDWPLIALLLPISTAVIRGAGNLGTRYGIEIMPDAVLASAVTFSVSSVLGLIVYLIGGRKQKIPLAWKPMKILAIGGLFTGGGMLCAVLAIKTGPVVVVVPIIYTYPLFAMLSSMIWLRQERITRRILLGVLLVVPSVAVIALAK